MSSGTETAEKISSNIFRTHFDYFILSFLTVIRLSETVVIPVRKWSKDRRSTFPVSRRRNNADEN